MRSREAIRRAAGANGAPGRDRTAAARAANSTERARQLRHPPVERRRRRHRDRGAVRSRRGGRGGSAPAAAPIPASSRAAIPSSSRAACACRRERLQARRHAERRRARSSPRIARGLKWSTRRRRAPQQHGADDAALLLGGAPCRKRTKRFAAAAAWRPATRRSTRPLPIALFSAIEVDAMGAISCRRGSA